MARENSARESKTDYAKLNEMISQCNKTGLHELTNCFDEDDATYTVIQSRSAKSIGGGENALDFMELRKRAQMFKDQLHADRYDNLDDLRFAQAKTEYRRLSNLAANATFDHFNPRGVQHGELDLHHLSVEEAKVKLVERLPAAAAAVRERYKTRGGQSRWVLVVTGAGTHSVGPPKLEEAVKGWLVGLGVRVRPRDRGVFEADAFTVTAAFAAVRTGLDA